MTMSGPGLLAELLAAVERIEGKVDAVNDRVDFLDSKVDSTLGHIAVLNDAHEGQEQFQSDVRKWRVVVDSWRGTLDGKLRLGAWIGIGFTALSAFAAWGLDDIILNHLGVR